MPIEKVNTTDIQSDETNVDWLATGERMTEENLNRPVKQVAEVLNNAIDDIESEFANLTVGTSNALQEEIADRTSADDAEQTARINADNALQSNIDAEIQNRTNVDNALRADIDAEIDNRIAADDNERAARIAADNHLTYIAATGKNALNLNPYFDRGEEHYIFPRVAGRELYTPGATGSKALKLSGNNSITYAHKIPIDTSKVYKVHARVKSIGATGARVYAGVATYDKDGNVETTTPGAHRYCAANNVRVPSDGTWHDYVGTITGRGNSNHNQFRHTSKYASPVLLVNYDQDDSYVIIVDELSIEDITEVKRADDLLTSRLDRERIVCTNGYKVITNRYTRKGGETASSVFNNDEVNYVDIYPPDGYSIGDLKGFIASPRTIHFAGTVNSDDSLFCWWKVVPGRNKLIPYAGAVYLPGHIRVICNNTENRGDSSINYLAIWRKD